MRRSIYLVRERIRIVDSVGIGLDWTMVSVIFLVRDSVALSSLKLPFSFSFLFLIVTFYYLILLLLA